MTQSLRTPMRRVRGHGAARAGTAHFIAERVTSILLALLAPYLFISAALQMEPTYASARAFVGQPAIAPVLFVFLLVALYHMQLGMQVVIEDYIHKPASRAALLLVNAFVALALAASGGFAILYLSLGA